MGKSKTREVQTGRQENTMSMDPTQQAGWNAYNKYVSGQTFDPYTGQMVADPNANQQAAWNQAGGIGQLGQDQMAAASQAAQNAAGYSPQQVGAQNVQGVQAQAGPLASAGQVGNIANIQAQQVGQGQVAGQTNQNYGVLRGNVRDVQAGQFGNLDPYMNEYNNQVVNNTLGDIDRSRQMAVNSGGDQAASAGAFGGSRQGVADSLTNEAYARQSARTSADLRARGFDTAAAIQQGDLNRNLQAGGMNQNADQNVLGMTGDMAGQTAFNNQRANLQAGMANQGTQLARGQTNAQLGTQASMANSANMFRNNQFNAGQMQQAGLANQSANLQAGMANQNAGLTANGQQIQAGGLLGNLGAQQQNMGINGMNALGWAGGQQYGIDQAGLDAGYQQYMNQQNWNQQNIDNRFRGIAGQPGMVNSTQTNYETQTQPGWGSRLAGGALTLAGTALGGPIGGMIGNKIGGMFGGGSPGAAQGISTFSPMLNGYG